MTNARYLLCAVSYLLSAYELFFTCVPYLIYYVCSSLHGNTCSVVIGVRGWIKTTTLSDNRHEIFCHHLIGIMYFQSLLSGLICLLQNRDYFMNGRKSAFSVKAF